MLDNMHGGVWMQRGIWMQEGCHVVVFVMEAFPSNNILITGGEREVFDGNKKSPKVF